LTNAQINTNRINSCGSFFEKKKKKLNFRKLEFTNNLKMKFREQDKKLQRETAWRKVSEKAAANAKALGLTKKYEEILQDANYGYEFGEEYEYDELNMDEAAKEVGETPSYPRVRRKSVLPVVDQTVVNLLQRHLSLEDVLPPDKRVGTGVDKEEEMTQPVNGSASTNTNNNNNSNSN